MKKKTAHKQKRTSFRSPLITGICVVIALALACMAFRHIFIPQDSYCTIQKQPTSVPPDKIKTAFEYFQLGDYYFDQGDCTRALANYTYSIELKPTAEAYNNRGYTYMRLRDYIHALADLDNAIVLRSNYATAYANRGDIRLFYYGIDPRSAIADYDKVIASQQPLANSICGHRAIAISQLNKPWGWNIFSYLYLRTQPPNFGCLMQIPR